MRYGRDVVEPAADDVPFYETLFAQVYRRFYPAVAPLSQTISDLQAAAGATIGDA
jgi:hypothetical protein